MLKMRVATFVAAAAVASALFGSIPAFAQAGPNVTTPVINDSTRTNTDAAKKAIEAERKRAEDEAKKGKGATGK